MSEARKPVFRVNAGEAAAREKVSSVFLSNRWNDFRVISSTLIYTPFWFFSFDIHSTAGGKTSITARGNSALDAFSKGLDDRFAGLPEMFYVPSETSDPESHGHSDKGDIEMEEYEDAVFLKQRLSEAEAVKIIPLLLADRHNALKDDVIVSGLEFKFVPVWKIEAEAGGNKYVFEICAADGAVLGTGGLQMRMKTEKELFAETMRGLSSPSAWLAYFSEMAGDIFWAAANVFRNPKNSSPAEKNARGQAGHLAGGNGHVAGGAAKGHGQGNGHAGSHGNGSGGKEVVLEYGVSFADPRIVVLLLSILAVLVIIWVFFMK